MCGKNIKKILRDNKENYEQMPDDYKDTDVTVASRGEAQNVTFSEEASSYNDYVKGDMLRGTNIENTHAEFASSVKPVTNQPSRNIIRDDYQDPNVRIGLPRSNSFLMVDRSIGSRDIPSQTMDEMYYGNTITFNQSSDEIAEMLPQVPKEVY